MRLAPMLCILAVSSFAEGPAASKHRFTVGDLWAVKRVGTPVLSSDGTHVFYTVSAWDTAENRSNADVFVVPLAGGTPRRLTTSKASDTSVAVSPDGRRIAFVSRREGDAVAQLYLLSLSGGEAERLTDRPSAVSNPKWLPDGKHVAFVSSVVKGAETSEETKRALEAREKNPVKARVSDNRLYRFWDRWLTDEEYPHIFVLDLETRAVRDLLPGATRLFDLQEGTGTFDVSPDGVTLFFSANSTEPPYRTLNRDVFSVPVAGGPVTNLTSDNVAEDGEPVVSPDGKTIAYGAERRADGWPDYTRVAVKELATGATRYLTEGWEHSVSGLSFTPDGKDLLFHAEVRARTHLYRLSLAGGAPRPLVRGGTTTGALAARGGAIVFGLHSLTRPPELMVLGPRGDVSTLTSVNDDLVKQWDLGEVRERTFSGAGDAEVQMYLVLPPGYEPGKKYPLVHLVHGGPVGTFGDGFNFRWNAQAFAAPGYVVAMVNFHGSSSFGQPFVESILGAHSDKPFTDVMRATDLLVAEGAVDPSRMAAAGGSYGGFLVNWIAGHTDRFRALVSHAGVYSLLGQFASDSTHGRHHSYGGYPYTNRDGIEKWSPNRYASTFVTPMLILHGERDFRVPATQGLELYGTLTAKGVPARLVYYPDENHWILKGANSKHWYGEVLGWLARWLEAGC
jgi:dipeptidyl aminopeptidase/acylaminoacyl peptidase